MESMKLPPFYVGQKVVYISSHNFPKNSRWIVRDIKIEVCGCYLIKIDANNKFPDGNYLRCSYCEKSFNRNDYKFYSSGYANSLAFRAIEEKPSYMTFEQIKEKEKEQVLINN